MPNGTAAPMIAIATARSKALILIAAGVPITLHVVPSRSECREAFDKGGLV
jgi:hypothetical protein